MVETSYLWDWFVLCVWTKAVFIEETEKRASCKLTAEPSKQKLPIKILKSLIKIKISKRLLLYYHWDMRFVVKRFRERYLSSVYIYFFTISLSIKYAKVFLVVGKICPNTRITIKDHAIDAHFS